MPVNKRKYKWKSIDLNIPGVKTRRQKEKISFLNNSYQTTKKNKMAKPSVDILLNFIPVFDGKRDILILNFSLPNLTV